MMLIYSDEECFIRPIALEPVFLFQAANVHLTPCTLELGGKSPVYVDENCNVEVAVKRLLWGKMVNLGQTVIVLLKIFFLFRISV